jgi:hypothetical protein
LDLSTRTKSVLKYFIPEKRRYRIFFVSLANSLVKFLLNRTVGNNSHFDRPIPVITKVYFSIFLSLSLKLKASIFMIAGSDTLEFAAGANVGEFASKSETMIKIFLVHYIIFNACAQL